MGVIRPLRRSRSDSRAAGRGRALQFDGHLDTVHLPFIPPKIEDGRITGSGASDMKAGIAAAVEAVRALRDAQALTAGSVLLTAHDLHEAPWGDSSQLDQLIRDGHRGDAVLLPEPLRDVLPVAGRGSATWKVTIRRQGPPVHEVMRPPGEPSVIAAAAELVARLGRLEDELRASPHPVCGPASVFIGQIHSGEIYNQYPQAAWLEGTRRWLPGTDPAAVERDFRDRLDRLADDTRTAIDVRWMLIRDAFTLDPDDPLVASFQRCYETISGTPLPLGPKPFVDDGNSFSALGGVPAITHGPRAGGSTRSMNGSRSMTSSASPCCTRRPPSNSARLDHESVSMSTSKYDVKYDTFEFAFDYIDFPCVSWIIRLYSWSRVRGELRRWQRRSARFRG